MNIKKQIEDKNIENIVFTLKKKKLWFIMPALTGEGAFKAAKIKKACRFMRASHQDIDMVTSISFDSRMMLCKCSAARSFFCQTNDKKTLKYLNLLIL